MLGEKLNKEMFVNLLVTGSRTAKTPGLYHQHLMDVTAGSGRPHGTCRVSHRTNELLINQKTVPDWQATSPTVEKAKKYEFKGRTRT